MQEVSFHLMTVGLSVYSGIYSVVAYAEGGDGTVANIIITILASAVAILWRKVEANYKKLDKANSKLSADLLLANSKIEECETDRTHIKNELHIIKSTGCTLGGGCMHKGNT